MPKPILAAAQSAASTYLAACGATSIVRVEIELVNKRFQK